ncbi:MAG: aldo/keto reductase [Planctomycetota bacterium]|jgi:aryl-alcohol dehydrogenase-like predicted oxidoreductase
MESRLLGRTGLEVTQLGFGAMELRGPKTWSGRDVTEQQSEAILNAVLDSGINFIDTAYDYGHSEERIGRYISSRRSEYHLATKCGCDPRDAGDRIDTPHLWTRDNLFRNIHGSLERMKTDHVEVLQLHNPKVADVRKGKLVEALQDIQAQGMTKFIGISATLPDLSEFVEMGVFETFQIPYSCLEPEHHDAITLAAESGAGIIIRGGIGAGGPESEVQWRVKKDAWQKAELDELLDGMKPAELILRYTLMHPHCHTTIVGTLNPEHLAENLAAAGKGPLPAELHQEVRRRVSKAAEGQ